MHSRTPLLVSPDRRNDILVSPYRRNGILLALGLNLLSACSGGTDAIANVSPPVGNPTDLGTLPAMSNSLSLTKHFRGIEGELAQAAGEGNIAQVARLIQDKGANPNAMSDEGMPLLLWPVHTGNLKGFEALLQHGAKINQAVPPGDVLFGFVIELRGLEFVRVAIAAGADVNARNADGEPMTFIARRHQRWDVVKALIQKGADINAILPNAPVANLLGDTVGFGDFENAYWLLQQGADAGFRLTAANAPNPARVGAQPILEDIFHRPIDKPELKVWQKKCQELLLAKGFSSPPKPKRFQ
jgi:uncharacterized protein